LLDDGVAIEFQRIEVTAVIIDQRLFLMPEQNLLLRLELQTPQLATQPVDGVAEFADVEAD
jgi:hypothetical protein